MKKTEKSPSLMRGTRFLILSASRPLRNKTAVRVCKKASRRNALRPSASRTSTSRALLAARPPPPFSHPSSGRPGPADRPRPVRSLRPSCRALPPARTRPGACLPLRPLPRMRKLLRSPAFRRSSPSLRTSQRPSFFPAALPSRRNSATLTPCSTTGGYFAYSSS